MTYPANELRLIRFKHDPEKVAAVFRKDHAKPKR
jgi:hypothetical protein